jgi:hypothetical protein
MPFCKFFAEGRCAKGNSCEFQHTMENVYSSEFYDSQRGPWTTEEGQRDSEVEWGTAGAPAPDTGKDSKELAYEKRCLCFPPRHVGGV